MISVYLCVKCLHEIILDVNRLKISLQKVLDLRDRTVGVVNTMHIYSYLILSS